ncbi:MAG: hydroxymethylglutaryl-CoA lyase [Pigmentiphaga sp.]
MSDFITVREVGLRDGLQLVPFHVDTDTKLAWFQAEAEAGVSAFEVTSFVSRKAMPQFADAEIVAAKTAKMPGVSAAALALNGRGAERALEAGVGMLVFVISASQAHSKGNAGRSADQALAEFADIMAQVRACAPERRPQVLAGVATAFGCTLEGAIDPARVRQLMSAMAELGPDEMALADTVGFANPAQVKTLCREVKADIGNLPLGLHLHDTRGLALVNVVAGLEAGVTTFDAALGGLGGCPFAPGASGNVATEDLVYLLHTLGLRTGIHLPKLLKVREQLAHWLPGVDLHGAVGRAGIPPHQVAAMEALA